MKNILWIGTVIGILCSSSMSHAETAFSLKFKGDIIDGPFAGKTVRGHCTLDPDGDAFKQRAQCVTRLVGDGFRLLDNQASVEVVGGGRALRIVLGPTMNSGDKKGNFKLAVFKATTFYQQAITLFDLPDRFSAVELAINGVSVAGSGDGHDNTDVPDCLIWDIGIVMAIATACDGDAVDRQFDRRETVR